MDIKKTYHIVPEMKFYDQITCDYKPFVMFFNKQNFKSEIVNTDELGFRLNLFDNILKKQSDFFNSDEISIIIGGSLVFGFGATSDKKTISSILSKKTKQTFLNFGATAFNSTQELLLFLNFFQNFKKIKKVIIISGANDLYLNLTNTNDNWGNFFFKEKFEKIHNFYRYRKNYKKKINNLFLKFLKNKKKIINSKPINFNQLDLDYKKILILWSSLAKNYNFDLHFYLQPFSSWIEKPLSIKENELFKILDNSDDRAHLILKEISSLENYKHFSNILQNRTKENGINLIDLNTELKKSKNLDKSLFVDRVHMNDLGYEEISNIILNNI